MKIALVHSFYASANPSGENLVVRAQRDALRRAGHQAHLIAVHTDDLAGHPGYPVRTALTVATGFGRNPREDLHRLDPDLVHVHNLFPNFGDRWVRHWAGPLVCTVHNVRPVCAAGTFTRDGRPCTDCLTAGNPLPALRHRCYRGSLVATGALAWAQRVPVPRRRLLARADAVIVPAERSRALWAGTGLPAERLAVLPHFVTGPDTPPDVAGPREGFVWVGRLSPEKGLPDLLRVWPDTLPLTVLGDGPLRAECARIAPASVRFVGAVAHRDVLTWLSRARALIVTTACMETFGLVQAEAAACGTPVVAVDGSTVADAVREHGTGEVVDATGATSDGTSDGTSSRTVGGTSDGMVGGTVGGRSGSTIGGALAAVPDAAQRVAAHGAELRAHCRDVYTREYTEAVWVRRAEARYRAVLDGDMTADAGHPSLAGTRRPE
jgi:glycosyltransferase involved in cell wall biosynthesis